jgi:hypothetical protein
MIHFSPESHTYTVDGVRYPSVTQIISDMGLYGDTSYFTDYCRERGSFVHKIIQYHTEGTLDEATIDPALQGYFDAWLKFQREADFVSDACEKVMVSDSYRFAGTVDHVGHLNGHYTCLDVKTGGSSPAHALQTAGYSILLKHPGVRRFSLHVKNDGKYKLIEHKDSQDMQIFKAAVAIWYWKRNNDIKEVTQ